jgi:hypothetical protein
MVTACLYLIPLSLVLIRTVRSWYFKEDIFAHNYTGFVVDELHSDEVMQEMCKPVWINDFSMRHWFPALISQSHSCQPQVIISENGKWKATITHIKWNVLPGLMAKSEFAVRYERVQ